MEYKTFDNKVMFRLDPGDELVGSLQQLCKTLEIRLGIVTGLGATNDVTIGLYEVASKRYHQKTMKGDHEIAPLYGNITTMNGEVYLHLHVNICDKTLKSYCGHLNKAVISVTFEGIIDVIEGTVQRIKDNTTGLNILSI